MSSVVGTWIVTTDLDGCVGNIAGSFDLTFHADGTWTDEFGFTGRWYQVEGLVVWDFDDAATLTYAANLAGSWMSGALGYTSGELKGCFGAHKQGVPGLAAAAIAAKRVRPNTGQEY